MKTGRSKPRPGYLRLDGAENGRRSEYSHIRNLQGATINECSFRWNFISRSAHATSFKCQPSPKESGTTPTHPISIIKESKLAEITGQEVLQVNTFHHQAIRELAPGFKITAWAPDSIAEAIEAYPIRQMIGVQFHPEIFTAAGDTTMHKLFKFLVNKADTFNLAKKFTAAFYPLTLIQILLFGLKTVTA